MKTNWDYSDLAQAYVRRPDYAAEAVGAILDAAAVAPGAPVCDMGAGVGHLTLHLCRAGLDVTALEPNDAMRALGMSRTAEFRNVRWADATAEQNGQPDGAFALVTFGSSFNVTDRPTALRETHRLLRPGGLFACLWNHRDLADPTQAGIEAAIKALVAGYDYGTRREDQRPVIEASGLFSDVREVRGRVLHEMTVDDCKTAWRSHATLQRQAGERFGEVVAAIDAVLDGLGRPTLVVPYTTQGWMARRG